MGRCCQKIGSHVGSHVDGRFIEFKKMKVVFNCQSVQDTNTFNPISIVMTKSVKINVSKLEGMSQLKNKKRSTLNKVLPSMQNCMYRKKQN